MELLHPRAAIRHAVVAVLQAHTGIAAALGPRIHPNRAAHWAEAELPAAGVYTLSEEPVESDLSPAPDERKMALVVEILVRDNVNLDDTLDALSALFEDALYLPAIGKAVQALGAADTLLVLRYTGTDIGFAAEGGRDMGVMVLNYEIEYGKPAVLPPLPDFLLGVTGWDVAPADGNMEAVDHIHFDPEK